MAGGGGGTCHDEMSTVKPMNVDKNNADETARQKIMNTKREGFNAFCQRRRRRRKSVVSRQMVDVIAA